LRWNEGAAGDKAQFPFTFGTITFPFIASKLIFRMRTSAAGAFNPPNVSALFIYAGMSEQGERLIFSPSYEDYVKSAVTNIINPMQIDYRCNRLRFVVDWKLVAENETGSAASSLAFDVDQSVPRTGGTNNNQYVGIKLTAIGD